MIDTSIITTPETAFAVLPEAYYLRNVRLETGFVHERKSWLSQPVITHTRTELKTLHIAAAKIAAILDADAVIPSGAAVHDAQGQLMLPTFRDMHIHLDKSFYGGPWEASLPTEHSIADRIAQERALLSGLLPVAQERTAAMVRLMQSRGTTICRTHCNVDPVSKLGNLEHLKASLERVKDTLEAEIIVFPQHGLLASDSVGLVREALASGGVGYLGGVDPTSFDKDMEKSLDTTVALALEFGVGLDIHFHEGREAAVPTFLRLMGHMEQNPQLRGNVTFSHAFALAELSAPELADMVARMRALGVTLATAVPLGRQAMPLREIHEASRRHLRHRQRDRLVGFLRQLRYVAKGQRDRPPAISQHRIRSESFSRLCDGLCHAARRQGRSGLAEGRRRRQFQPAARQLFGRSRRAFARPWCRVPQGQAGPCRQGNVLGRLIRLARSGQGSGRWGRSRRAGN
ncbi:hypothetical protein QWZ10_05910 [Paracoccus cavernae]|uniref:Deaminase n=1 Tax=Paracoccus cavernae TaxID=1571207 RepID=A0ABT8D4Q6_9RHOB|nr:hypothetical protein [Paracoccus cavernae]